MPDEPVVGDRSLESSESGELGVPRATRRNGSTCHPWTSEIEEGLFTRTSTHASSRRSRCFWQLGLVEVEVEVYVFRHGVGPDCEARSRTRVAATKVQIQYLTLGRSLSFGVGTGFAATPVDQDELAAACRAA